MSTKKEAFMCNKYFLPDLTSVEMSTKKEAFMCNKYFLPD
jgi:hypothetical protein